MKKFILAFLVLFPLILKAQPILNSEECNLNNEMNDFIGTLFDPGCLKEEAGPARCECLATEQPNNFLIRELDKKTNIKNYQKEVAAERTQYFFKVYSQMTHGAALQKQIMFGEDDKDGSGEKVVGCTPVEVAESYNENLKNHVDKLEEKRKKAMEEVLAALKTCQAERRKCNVLMKQKEILESEIGGKKAQLKTFVDNANENTKKSGVQVELEAAKNWYEGKSPLIPMQKTLKLSKIDCYLLRVNITAHGNFQKYEDKKCTELTGPIPLRTGEVAGFASAMFAPTVAGPVGKGMEQGLCDETCLEIDQFIKDYKQEREKKELLEAEQRKLVLQSAELSASISRIVAEKAHKKAEIKIADCKDDEFCKNFEAANNKVLNALQDDFQQTGNNCITYPEFLLKKGIPGRSFMEELAQLPPEKLEEALSIPKVLNTKADKQRLEFLRSNPIVAKLAIDPKNRKTMAQALQNFAKGGGHKTHPQRLDDYLNFMKTTVKDLMKNEDFKSQQQFICKQMINSFTAIQVASDLPPLKENPNEFPLQAAIRECKISLNNAVSQTSTKETLESNKMNDLFREIEDLTGDTEPEKSDQQRFQDINKKRCEGYADFMKTCKGDPESCRQEFLSKSKEGREERQAYQRWNTTTDPNKINFNNVANESRVSYQDKQFKRWWDDKVGSKMGGDAIAYKGDEAEFSHDQQANMSKVANTSVPEEFKSNESSSNQDQGQAIAGPVESPQSQVNPGQIIPSFATPAPVFDPAKLVPGQSVTKAITNYEDLAPKERISGLDEAREYLEKQEKSLKEEELENLLEETKEKIAEEQKQQEELEKKIAESKSGEVNKPQFTSAVNQFSHQPSVAPVTSGGGSTGSTFGNANGLSKTSTGFGAVNDALKLKETNNRVPANTEQLDVTVKSGVVKTEELKGKLEVSQELTTETPADFMKLVNSSSELEKYIEATLDKKSIGDGKIISIVNPAETAPIQHLIFRVHLENGRYVIQSMPADVKVTRSSTLDRLRLNLKTFSKPKKAI